MIKGKCKQSLSTGKSPRGQECHTAQEVAEFVSFYNSVNLTFCEQVVSTKEAISLSQKKPTQFFKTGNILQTFCVSIREGMHVTAVEARPVTRHYYDKYLRVVDFEYEWNLSRCLAEFPAQPFEC